MIVQTNGVVFSCGDNESFELGHGNQQTYNFERIDKLETQVIRKVFCGNGYSVALNDTGQLLVWGKNTSGQLGIGFTDEAAIKTPKYDCWLDNIKI